MLKHMLANSSLGGNGRLKDEGVALGDAEFIEVDLVSHIEHICHIWQ